MPYLLVPSVAQLPTVIKPLRPLLVAFCRELDIPENDTLFQNEMYSVDNQDGGAVIAQLTEDMERRLVAFIKSKDSLIDTLRKGIDNLDRENRDLGQELSEVNVQCAEVSADCKPWRSNVLPRSSRKCLRSPVLSLKRRYMAHLQHTLHQYPSGQVSQHPWSHPT